MTGSIVSKLKQQLEIAGIDTLHLSDKEAALFERSIEPQAKFFDTICKNNQQKDPNLLLLGLLTKLQTEATAKLDSQADTLAGMKSVLSNTVGSHAEKFSAEAIIELSLVTKIWLMVQGYLNMDFSLANDYASSASALLAKSLRSHELDELRTELIASYYHGKEKRQIDSPSIIQWPEKLLAWFSTKI